MELHEEELLARVHDASGSTLSANSRRLRTLRNNPDALAQCRSDVKKDIEKFVHVSVEAKAKCVHRFAERADVVMHVCGACGIRDPFDPYTATAKLNDLAPEHWLQVGKDAYRRLQQWPDMELLRPGANGGYEPVMIPRTDLHSLFEVGQHAYHVVPEAVLEGQQVKLCKRCGRGWEKRGQAKRTAYSPEVLIDDFEDLYASNAPALSIAHGEDFGRLSALRSKGIRVDVSTLEQLLLAEARCHQIVYKVIAYGQITARKRLHGHSIVFPHHAQDIEPNGFGKAALEAAFAAVRIVFVGPDGMRQKMEDIALKIEDLRLRPDVIFNFLTLNHLLHNGPAVPSMDEVVRLIEENSLAAYINKHARSVPDTSIDEIATPSDVAGVRFQAQTDDQRIDSEDPEASTVAEGEALAPHMVPIGVFEAEPQRVDAVLLGIQRALTEEGGNASNASTDAVLPDVTIPAGNARTLVLQRDDHILSDYGSAADVIYKTWWSLLPLRRGLVRGKSIPDAKWHQMFLYFDNRFAHDMPLLFHAANVVMRHAVNKAVSVTVKTNAVAFKNFSDLVHDEGYMNKLIDARADPKGPAAREVLTRVLRFVNLSASKVPWGSGERNAEVTKLYADHRTYGSSSVFYSVAPDDVHNPMTIRWAWPYTGPTTFPAKPPAEFLQALQGRQPSERTAYDNDGRISFAMDETSLQRLAAKNPVACAIHFDHLVDNVRTNLLGLSRDRKNDVPMRKRESGSPGACNVFLYLASLSCL
jgi:hypothetical protein